MIAYFSSELTVTLPYASSGIQNASEQFVSYIHLCFCELGSFSSDPINKGSEECVRQIHRALFW
jgi:hypothetical protein